MGQIYNNGKPYIYLWGKFIIMGSHIFIKVVDDVGWLIVITWFVLLLVSACYNPGFHSLIYRDTGRTRPDQDRPGQTKTDQARSEQTRPSGQTHGPDNLTTWTTGFDSPLPPSQWRRFDMPSVFFPHPNWTF